MRFFFNLYNLLRQPKNSKTAQNILSILEFFSPESFEASRFFEVPKTLSRDEIFSIYIICPKLSGRKEFPNCPKQL
jgi:hypothetical protein